jgi:capsular exopolysaccharide synthesis family protein
MNLRDYFQIIWRRKWVILATSLTIVIIVMLVTLRIPPTYSATTTIRIALTNSGSPSYEDYIYSDRLMNTYVDLATTTPVLDLLKQRLGLNILPKISVKTVPNTELIRITVEYSEPNTAALVANTLADILISQSLELYRGGGKSSLEILSEQVATMEKEVNQARTEYLNVVANDPNDTVGIQTAKDKLDINQQMYASILDQYEQARLDESQRANSISVVEPANPPLIPSKPNRILNIALGFIVGAAGGLGLAFLFENLDYTLYTTDQIEKITKLPLIGRVPHLGKNVSAVDMNRDFAFSEAFRHLRTNLLNAEVPIKTLLITSAQPKEGKSRIISNLAVAMARSGRSVLVIDADLRIPSLHENFNLDNDIGLSTVLLQKCTYEEAVQSCGFQGVQVLPSGPSPINPSELLGSDQMKDLIKQVTKIFDLVIIDAPAALAVTDTSVLAPLVDAVALVICRGKVSSNAVRSAEDQINRVNARWIGVIINQAEMNESRYYYDNKRKL